MSKILEFQLQDKKEGEEIVLQLHRSGWIFAPVIFKAIIFGILPLLALIRLFPESSVVPIVAYLVIIAGLSYIFFEWFNWYRDLFVLTNERLITIDQKSFFHRLVSETTLDTVIDVTYETKGVAQSSFGFGSVIISTSGSLPKIEWKNINTPGKIQKKVMATIDDYVKRHKSDVSAKELIDLIIDENKK